MKEIGASFPVQDSLELEEAVSVDELKGNQILPWIKRTASEELEMNLDGEAAPIFSGGGKQAERALFRA